jgi:alcohol dehydrogenase class IV
MGDFAFPTRIIEGNNSINKIADIIRDYGSRVLLIGDRIASEESGWLQKIKTILEDHTHGVILYDKVDSRSNSDAVNQAAEQGKYARCDVVIGFGGRTTLHISKAVAFLISHGGILEDYFLGKKGKGKSVSYIEIPTTPGYSPGLTANIQVTDRYDGLNKFLEAELFADVLIVDPKLTISLSEDFVKSIGIETIALSIETFLSKRSNFLVETHALKAIEMVHNNLTKSLKDPENTKLRNLICQAGVLTSLSLKDGSNGLSYAIAMAINSIYGINQALALSVILPYVMEFNLTTAANKLVFICKAFGENVSEISVVEAAIKAIENVRKLSIEHNIPQRLSELNIGEDELIKIAKIARNYDFLHNLPRPVSREDILTILSSAY